MVKIIFDGRDKIIELMISAKHIKYPAQDMTTILTANPNDLIEKGVNELKKHINLSL